MTVNLYGPNTTVAKLQAGSFSMKWVLLVEGCPYAFTDAPRAAAAAAHAGTDWALESDWLGGLFVELDNTQSITPLKHCTSTGGAVFKIHDADRSDTFGQFVAKRQGGRESTITSSLGTNETTIPVRSTNGWPSSGLAYLGTECIAYTGTTANSLTGVTRGMYSPAGCAASGSGGSRFGNPHRVGTDINHVQLNPVISTIPRVWINKRVVLYLHWWDPVTQTLNSRADAQRVFVGRIARISEDKKLVGTVSINADHLMHDFEDAVVWRDQFTADLKPGLALVAGRTFQFKELAAGFPTATELVVVSGAPASTNEIQEGTYSLSGLVAAINAWLGGNKAAGTINGYYSFASPVSNAEGLRTVVNWYNDHATDSWVAWRMGMPSEVASFLGFADGDPTNGGSQVTFEAKMGRDATQLVTSGSAVPFESLIFRPQSSRLGSDYTGATFMDADNVTGTFINQYLDLPAMIKESCDPSGAWGVFLFDEKVLMVGYYDEATQRLRNCWVPPIPLSGSNDTAPASYFGRRADEPDRGPVKVRQALWIESSRALMILKLLYSTGTPGYNHAEYDTLGSGIGAGIPGDLLSDEFEASVWNLPGADGPRTIWLDEPKKLSEMITGELALSLAFIRWKDQHFELSQWRTPMNANAIATLSESNKAAPVSASGGKPDHRAASEETNEHVRPVIKFDYAREQAAGRNGDFTRSFMFEDQTSVDDAGGGVEPITIKLPHVLAQHQNAGASVESVLPDFMARMTSISRSSRKIARSLDHRYIEIIAPGDTVTVSDLYARDPLTGRRGVSSRAAFVTSSGWDLGGPSPVPGEDPRDPGADVIANFLDTQRGQTYAPAADIDDTANAGGFTAGYNAATKTVRCYPNHYSHVMTITRARGSVSLDEGHDAQRFAVGDKVNVIERDPANPAAPLTWPDTILSVSGDDLGLTTGLAGFSATKRYRIVPRKWSEVQVSQREAVYQADSTDEWVEDTELPWHFSATDEPYDFTDNTPTAPAEFVPDMCYGDGRPWDVGHDQAIARFLNAFIDYKSAHQAPFLHAFSMGPVDTASSTWATLFFGPVFLGTEHLSSTVTRSLIVAPWFRSSSAGNTAKVRITITDTPPAMAINPGFLPGECYRDSILNGKYSRSDEYSTTSTTWQQGSDASLSLGVKDIFFGFVWVLIEGTGFAECRGLAKCIEGPRQVL